MEAGVALRDRHHDAEGPWELPQGWCWAVLDQVVESVQTTDPRKYLSDQPFHYIDLGAIQQGVIVGPQTVVGSAAPSRARQVVRPGDTLFSCVRVYLRNIALVPEGLASPIASTAFCVLRPSEAIDADYLHYFVQSRRFIEWMMPLQRGNSPPAVLDIDVKAQLVPLPPYREQLRIAARISQLFAEIAEGDRAMAEAHRDLEKFRSALLKAAVTGELTKDWREANPVTESGHDLLDRIAKLRSARGPAKGRGRRSTSAEVRNETDLPTLPEGWAWATIDQLKLSDQRNGISIAGSVAPPGVKAMRLDALTSRGLDLDAVRFIPLPEDRISDYRVNAGDLLISRANGSADLVGRAVYVREIDQTVVFPDTIIRYPLDRSEQQGGWAELVWNSPFGRSQIRRLAKTTAGILKISQRDISQVKIPMPPPAEAAEIIRRVSESLATADDTLALLDAEAADVARLKQSILKAAFEGQLVPQDPADEPASALLARISVAGTSTARKARGRPRKDQ